MGVVKKNSGKCGAKTGWCVWMQWATGQNVTFSVVARVGQRSEVVLRLPKTWTNYDQVGDVMVRLRACPACGGDPNEGVEAIP